MAPLLRLKLPIRARSLPEAGVVDCWLVDVSDFALVLPAAAERDRSAHQALRLQRQFLLRLILGAYLNLPGKDVAVVRGASGKPGLAPAQAATGLQFNLSHSGAWMAVALTQGVPVGIDIEQQRKLARAADLASRYFSPAEADRLAALEEPERSDAFLALWTLREACIKAMGSSLAQALRDIALAVDGETLLSLPAAWPAPAEWTLQRLVLPAPLHACIAAPRSGLVVQSIQLDCRPHG